MTNTNKVDPDAPLQEGEFRRIKGIAETTERALQKAGIETFEHLALLTPAEIAAALPGSVGARERAARQDWAGQAADYARMLAASKDQEESAHQVPHGQEEREKQQQHYASFMVVLLMDKEQNVRRTTITHVQDDMRESWAGWEPQRLIGWIGEQAGLLSVKPAGTSLEDKKPHLPMEKRPSSSLTGALRLSPVKLVNQTGRLTGAEIHSGEPFVAGLIIDLSQVEAPPGKPLHYRAAAQVHRLKNWAQSHAIQLEGETLPGEEVNLEFRLPGLTEGAHHLEIAVLVAPKGSSNPTEEGIGALTEGIMVRVQPEELVTAGETAR